MKCDELEAEQWLDYRGEPRPCYPQKEVDSAIDELKKEHHRERDEYIDWVKYIDWVNKLQRENSELKDMVTTDNSAVIARLEDSLRKTQRALWLARAYRAGEHYRRYHGKYKCPLAEIPEYQKWLKVEHKCRAKAKEYE